MIETPPKLSREELAWEFVSLFDELDADQINEVLAKNVAIETLEFFSAYAERFAQMESIAGDTRKRIPNLMLLGYLLRLLEERLINDAESFDA